jgi:PAS domain S-box-containing protein
MATMKKTDTVESRPPSPRDDVAILQNAGLLQTILDSLTHPFYVIEVADYRVRLANRAARQTHEGGAATCHVLTHGRHTACDSEDHPCPVKTITETGQPTVVEHMHRDEHGNQRYIEVHAFPVFDEAGRVSQVIEYCVDVTEHKHMMQQRQWDLAVNRALAELADALIDPSFSIEEVTDVVLAQARQLTGSEHGFVSSIDSETGDVIGHTLTHMMAQQCRMSGDKRSIVFHRRPDGSYPALFGHALNTGRGFYTNAPGRHPSSSGLPKGHIPLRNFLTVPALVGNKVVGQIALANSDRAYSDRDLDAIGRMAKLYALAVERMRRQTALKTSEERYALAQKAANIGSWDWNIVTGKLLWSERIEPMFGFAKGQFASTYEAFLQSVHPDDRDFVVNSVNACVEGGADYRIEHRIVWPDGMVRWVSETGDVMRDAGGKAVRMLGVVQDITDRRQAEQEIRKLNEELEQRVLDRTTELTQTNKQLREEIARRRRSEKEILEISEREQRRIGRELHDSLGQQLTGIAIISKVLEQKLHRQSLKEAANAKEIAQLVNEAINQTRQLSRGLHPVSMEEDGLMSALQALAATTQNVFGVTCDFQCNSPVPVKDPSAATHLYRIAQEAVTNAIRHGNTKRILLELSADRNLARLVIENDGRDFPAKLPKTKGMGLQVMSYRAEMIGGALDVQPRVRGGTKVTCTFNVESIADRKEQ